MTQENRAMSGQNATYRVGFVDYAKGICIILVAMMHSTLGVEEAMGQAAAWLHGLVEFAKPFRMPDFFLIAGLFLARSIGKDWHTFLDRKVIHFVYFYALWVTIQYALRAPGIMNEGGFDALLSAYLLAYVEPFGTLWFIYLLPVFFVVTKLMRHMPLRTLAIAFILHLAQIETGWTVIDEFASRYIFFFIGYAFAPQVFAFAGQVNAHRAVALAWLAAWAVINFAFVESGLAVLPGIAFLLGIAGAAAVVAVATLLASIDMGRIIRYCGEHSIVIYLAFSPFMAATRILLIKTGVIASSDMVAFLVTLAAIAGPLMLYLIVRGTPARFLFARPFWARLSERPTARVFTAA